MAWLIQSQRKNVEKKVVKNPQNMLGILFKKVKGINAINFINNNLTRDSYKSKIYT